MCQWVGSHAPSFGRQLSTVGVRYLPIYLWDLFELNLIVPLPRGLVHSMFVPLISACCFGKAMLLSKSPANNN